MTDGSLDYELLTLFAEKRITAHVKAALRKRSFDEAKERSFFVASANEALFMWMGLASRMEDARYQVDRARLVRMVEDLLPKCITDNGDDENAKTPLSALAVKQ
ncbi:MAG TPA: hypothetical protein VJU59_00195 [Paraburkholderia sp.]|uniref:hypothetical protein n=1 Tax=Paraburkholderia sp. TaxID=1926495 RepID=UPI002B45B004|nr:hypothetical protein [Paraburkholderia sp.]HKR38088.1 hypothetical protein [Paraburkholderia sp.]